LLSGFREWLAVKAGTDASLAWCGIIKKLASDKLVGEEIQNLSLVSELFSQLDEFLAVGVSNHRASVVISRYAILQERRRNGESKSPG
jgi:hypothetical protein